MGGRGGGGHNSSMTLYFKNRLLINYIMHILPGDLPLDYITFGLSNIVLV